MRSLVAWCGLLGWCTLWVACSGSAGDLFTTPTATSGATGLSGRGGRGSAGRGSRAGDAGLAGEAGTSAGDAGEGEGAADAGGSCDNEEECDDGNECTLDVCDGASCRNEPVAAGTACDGNEPVECREAPTCDGEGACVAAAVANGTACEGGSCTLGECIIGSAVGCPAAVVSELPFEASWRTVGGVDLFDSVGCDDLADTPDFAVLFSAPASGTYRFEAFGEAGTDDPETPNDPDASLAADSILTIVAGACSDVAAEQIECNDDIDDGVNVNSRIDLTLEEGETVTVYAGEYREQLPGGGSGRLRISELGD
jgi:hypothetical protein